MTTPIHEAQSHIDKLGEEITVLLNAKNLNFNFNQLEVVITKLQAFIHGKQQEFNKALGKVADQERKIAVANVAGSYCGKVVFVCAIASSAAHMASGAAAACPGIFKAGFSGVNNIADIAGRKWRPLFTAADKMGCVCDNGRVFSDKHVEIFRVVGTLEEIAEKAHKFFVGPAKIFESGHQLRTEQEAGNRIGPQSDIESYRQRKTEIDQDSSQEGGRKDGLVQQMQQMEQKRHETTMRLASPSA